MTHKKVALPHGLVPPTNPITIQCRINPRVFYTNPTDADFIAPPATLAFARTTPQNPTGILPAKFNAKRKRGGEVQDIITNFYDINKGDRTLQSDLRCIGVTFDGVIDAEGVKKHPDSVGRLAIIVANAVTIVCNRDDLTNLHIGDILAWELQDNGQCYEGLPSNWSTAKIVRASSMGIGINTIDAPFESVFGPKKQYDHTNDEATLKARLGVLQKIAPASSLDVSHLAGVTPYDVAETLAHLIFAQNGIILDTRDAWVDKLYNPTSEQFCFEQRPEDRNSIKWILHAMGDEKGTVTNGPTNGKYIYAGPRNNVYDSSKKSITIPGEEAPDAYFNYIPQAIGWVSWLRGVSTIKTATPAKRAELDAICAMTAAPNADTHPEQYLVYKAVHGLDFTAEDWARFQLGASTVPDARGRVSDFVKGIFEGGTMHKRMRAIICLEYDYMDLVQKKAGNIYIPKMIDLARIGYTFFNMPGLDVTPILKLANADRTNDATDEAKLNYAKHVLNMHPHSQNVFGVLLEKNMHANEARVLLRI